MEDQQGIEYMNNGNSKQRECYKLLKEFNILHILRNYQPIVVGTIPININIDNSDIDIICYAQDLISFRGLVQVNFGRYKSFADKITARHYVASFYIKEIPVEIYAEPIPTLVQNGYRHMIIENRILQITDENFRMKIIKLKEDGYKTEPAFGKSLGLEEPYTELLELEKLSDKELVLFITGRI